MPSMSRSERAALCNAALEAGEEAPTLCGGWTVRDLVSHLLVRERRPLGSAGLVVPPLAGLTDAAMRRLADQDFSALVERVRNGPPRWSPMRVPPVEQVANTLEFFVHHEDIRRAAPDWQPRDLTAHEQRVLWKAVSTAGKGLVRRAGVPVEIRWPDSGRDGVSERTAVLRPGSDPVVVSGDPAEVTLFLFGRDRTRGLRVEGSPAARARLSPSRLGL